MHNFRVHNAQCTMYGIQCAMYNAQCTMYNVRWTVHNVQCTVHKAHCTVLSAQCTTYTAQCTGGEIRGGERHHLAVPSCSGEPPRAVESKTWTTMQSGFWIQCLANNSSTLDAVGAMFWIEQLLCILLHWTVGWLVCCILLCVACICIMCCIVLLDSVYFVLCCVLHVLYYIVLLDGVYERHVAG